MRTTSSLDFGLSKTPSTMSLWIVAYLVSALMGKVFTFSFNNLPNIRNLPFPFDQFRGFAHQLSPVQTKESHCHTVNLTRISSAKLFMYLSGSPGPLKEVLVPKPKNESVQGVP